MGAIRQLSGVSQTQGVEAIRRKRQQESEWPYEYLFAPPNSITVNGAYGPLGIQYVAVPAPGSTVTIATFQIPSSLEFVMHAVWLTFAGSFIPGDSLFSVTVNPGGGVQSNPVQGLINVPIPLGAWTTGRPWEFDRPYLFEPYDILSATAKNVNLSAGPPNYYVAGFFGYVIPVGDLR